MNEYLEKYLEQIKELLPSIEFKPHVEKKYTGYKYKHSPRGSSHHWLSFGIIHEPQLEYWFNIGAVKQLDDFEPIKEILSEINESKEAFKILEKKGQYFIKAGVLFNNADNEELEKGLNEILDAAKYALNELKGSGFLGIEKTEEIEPAKNAEENTIKCRACQTELDAGDKFCSNCGEKVEFTPDAIMENSEDDQEVFKDKMEKLWKDENWEDLVKCFEEKFNWDDLALKNSNFIVVIQHYLWGLYKIDGREIDALNRSKEVLIIQGCFDEVVNGDDNFASLQAVKLANNVKTIFTYAKAAKYLENIDEIKSAIEVLEKYDSDSDYIKELKDKIKELEKPQRNIFKIEFASKTKRNTENPLRQSFKKGKIIQGKFYYITEEKELSKKDCINILETRCDARWAIKYWIGNSFTAPKIDGWEDLTTPNVTKIEMIGKESDFDLSSVSDDLWSDY
jgi:hypothetical protein